MIIAETQMDTMPKACVHCDLFRIADTTCPAKQIRLDQNDYHWIPVERPNWCPLRETQHNSIRKDAER